MSNDVVSPSPSATRHDARPVGSISPVGTVRSLVARFGGHLGLALITLGFVLVQLGLAGVPITSSRLLKLATGEIVFLPERFFEW